MPTGRVFSRLGIVFAAFPKPVSGSRNRWWTVDAAASSFFAHPMRNGADQSDLRRLIRQRRALFTFGLANSKCISVVSVKSFIGNQNKQSNRIYTKTHQVWLMVLTISLLERGIRPEMVRATDRLRTWVLAEHKKSQDLQKHKRAVKRNFHRTTAPNKT